MRAVGRAWVLGGVGGAGRSGAWGAACGGAVPGWPRRTVRSGAVAEGHTPCWSAARGGHGWRWRPRALAQPAEGLNGGSPEAVPRADARHASSPGKGRSSVPGLHNITHAPMDRMRVVHRPCVVLIASAPAPLRGLRRESAQRASVPLAPMMQRRTQSGAGLHCCNATSALARPASQPLPLARRRGRSRAPALVVRPSLVVDLSLGDASRPRAAELHSIVSIGVGARVSVCSRSALPAWRTRSW